MQPTSRRHLEAIVRDQNGHPMARCLIRQGHYHIGQQWKNEIVIDDPSVAAQQARLTLDDDNNLSFENLNEANEIRINGTPVSGRVPIGSDSKIEIGIATLQFQRAGLPAEIFDVLPKGFLRTIRYNIGEAIVEGSTSTIFDALDTSLGRSVALKVMRPDSQANTAHVLRFIREAQITSQLQHSGILPIYELSLDEQSQLFYTTRFIEGESLATTLESIAATPADEPPPRSLASLLRVFDKVCDAVAFGHSRGVIHCGLRPEAITVGTYGEVFVVNWGLAKVGTENASGEPVATPLHVGPSNSLPQNTAFTAPEQASAILEDITVRTDVYSLGALLYRILTLKDCIVADNEDQLLEQILTGSVRPIAQFLKEPQAHCPGGFIPESLAQIATKALSAAPEERYGSVAEIQREVAAFEMPAPPVENNLWKQVSGPAWEKLSARWGRKSTPE